MHTIRHSPGAASMAVTFAVDEPDTEIDVILDIDFLLHSSWPGIDHLILRPIEHEDVRRSLTVELPSDVELSYRYLRRTRSIPASSPHNGVSPSLDELRALCATGLPDPDVHDRIHSPFGSEVTSSVLIGPDAAWRRDVWARPHPGTRRPPMSTLLMPDGRRVSIIGSTGKPCNRLVVLLDGDVWLNSLDLPAAIARWNRPTVAFAVVSTPDRDNLDDRRFMERTIAEVALPEMESHLDVRLGSEVTVVGHSYSGLAAAGLACDRPDRFGTAIIGSGSFWHRTVRDARDDVEPGDLTRQLQTPDSTLSGSHFLLHVGREEGGMVDQSRMFAEAARSAGAEVDLSIYPGGHDYAWYRHALFDALDTLRIPHRSPGNRGQ
ncbi:alpha/beta hydrolase [Brevibacterium oceani]|uniref:alpha/beta hydrolase n=1 Tax=Brevibacterium oceani TaxID=358099 RepID=UPI0015E79EEB|nr:alpha/beta hydrolase-fold protein [Brevibacterium oceani]